MERSVSKILTTHVGSLPFLSLENGIATGDATQLAEGVTAIVAQQREIGIDIINEGEYSKGGAWLRYMQNRFGGFTDIEAPEGNEHNMQMVADLADRLHVLDYGRTLGIGSAADVLNNSAVIAAYIGTQPVT